MKAAFASLAGLVGWIDNRGIPLSSVSFQMADGLPVIAFYAEKVGSEIKVIVSDKANEDESEEKVEGKPSLAKSSLTQTITVKLGLKLAQIPYSLERDGCEGYLALKQFFEDIGYHVEEIKIGEVE